jgi:hypothetical protein
MSGLIVIHPGPMPKTLCFDIFCPEPIPIELRDFGYKYEDCPYVKALNRSDYVCSEDTAHIPEINIAVVEIINKLIEKGFKVKVIVIEEEEEK